jgi:thiopurine S-methyltransferase
MVLSHTWLMPCEHGRFSSLPERQFAGWASKYMVLRSGYMEADFWHLRWQQNETGFHQKEFNVHLREFWGKLSIAPGGRVFVPLCGKSRDMLWLRSQGFKVLGVELSPIAVRDFFTENHLSAVISRHGEFERWEADGLTLMCGDFFDLRAEHLESVAAVYDRASLIALPPSMRARYAEHFCRVVPLIADGLLVTMEYPEAQMQGPPFTVHEREVAALYGARFALDKLFDQDLLAENPHFAAKGLSQLREKVYHLASHK